MSRMAWDAFRNGHDWRRSKKANLWRNWDGLTVTIFEREGDNYFGWCIADGDSLKFSQRGYETEEAAVTAAGQALEL